MKKLTKLGIVRSSWTGVVFLAFTAKFEFASPLLYHAVRRGILSKCGVHVLVDLLECFALETKVEDDRTMPDFVFSFSIFKVKKGSYV